MRLCRPSTLVASLLSLLIVSACAQGGETGVVGQLDPQAVEGTIRDGGSARDLPLRAAGAGAGAPSGEGDPVARPSPPTLSTPAGDEGTTAPTAPPASPPITTTSASPGSGQPVTTPPPAPTVTGETVAPTSASGPAGDDATSAPPDSTADLAAGEARSFALLDDLRLARGLGGLSRDGEMDAFARDWSRRMAESGQLEHSTGPYGENIAFTSNTQLSAAEAAELFHQLWLGSPRHYENMVDDSYVTAGIGLYLTERGWYGTHVFSL